MLLKRTFDLTASFIGLLVFLPILLPVLFLVWIQDFHSPFYIAPRVGKDGKLFDMIKLRSMIKNADKSGVDSTSSDDLRITTVGRFIRKFKLDEISQLWNVLKNDMSLVGPRPNVKRETDLYTEEEKKLLSVKPGITDFSSIVFSDEGEILAGAADPDIAYNQLIRPGKSRFGLFYVEKNSLAIDIVLIFTTLLSIFSRKRALRIIQKILIHYNAPADLSKLALRDAKLTPAPPPGAQEIVTSRS